MHTGTLNLHTLLVCEHKDKTNTDNHTASFMCKSLLQEELVNVWTTVAVDSRCLRGDRGSATALE